MINPTRRRLLVSGAAFGGALCLPNIGRAQSGPVDRLRIGVITPSRTGLLPIFVPGDDLIGDAARQGALMADGVVGEVAAQAGIRLDLMPSNAPTAEAAFRVAQRFVETDSVDAIIGGVGTGHAETISAIAEQAGVPFFNVASPNLQLRRDCLRYTFHIDASAAMYVDALVLLGVSQGYQRYFIVHEITPAGDELRQRAAVSVERLGGGATVVGAASARPQEAYYGPQLTAADDAGADAILLLIGDVDQLVFTAQEQSLAVAIPVLPLPYPNTQTREYVREVRLMSPDTNPDYRVTLWDPSLAQPDEAAEFNNRYIRQWGAPAEAPAWAAYQAVKIMVETVSATGSTDPAAIVDYLENSGAEFDVSKGPGVSFRPWDHQLRQPLYAIRVDQEAVWDWEFPTTHVALASVVGELPDSGAGGGDAIARLDLIGDGPEAGDCRL
jgi:ABC-type branched-subunit amino acid transport system substrate-binding protein